MKTNFLPEMEAIAREAGTLLLDYFERHVSFEYKVDVDLVTEADREAEALIARRIRRNWPQHDLICEEGARHEGGGDYCWYVDPLDGTTNFAHGFPYFCVSLGLAYQGELVAGVLYDPTRDELFAAGKSRGAVLNGRAIHVSAVRRLGEALLATGFPTHERNDNPNIHYYHHFTMRSHGIRRAGAAALDLTAVACGRVDGYWEFSLKPWDTAAGVLLVREAGGTVTRFDGSPWRMDSRETLATNGLIHEEMAREFTASFVGHKMEPLPTVEKYAKERV
jgi:myo-inositol-1(or 4)-monophosphatase